MLTSQVGINTIDPHPSASLDIRSSNKGVSFPKIFLQGRNDISTVPNPKESLIIYNTNGSVGGKEGFYYWNGTKWEYLFTDINQENLMNQMKYYSSNSSAAFTFTRNSPNQFLGYSAHTSGETLNTSQWTVIPALTKSIVIDHRMIYCLTSMEFTRQITVQRTILAVLPQQLAFLLMISSLM